MLWDRLFLDPRDMRPLAQQTIFIHNEFISITLFAFENYFANKI